MDHATSILGYVAEGITGYIFPTQETQTVPLYRSYQPSVFDHFYTVDKSESDNSVTKLSYSYEGITGYVSPPLVRLALVPHHGIGRTTRIYSITSTPCQPPRRIMLSRTLATTTKASPLISWFPIEIFLLSHFSSFSFFFHHFSSQMQ